MADFHSYTEEEDLWGTANGNIDQWGVEHDSLGSLLTPSASFKGEGKGSKKKNLMRSPNMEGEDIIHLLHGSDPVKVELNRLENDVRGNILCLSVVIQKSVDFI